METSNIRSKLEDIIRLARPDKYDGYIELSIEEAINRIIKLIEEEVVTPLADPIEGRS